MDLHPLPTNLRIGDRLDPQSALQQRSSSEVQRDDRRHGASGRSSHYGSSNGTWSALLSPELDHCLLLGLSLPTRVNRLPPCFVLFFVFCFVFLFFARCPQL